MSEVDSSGPVAWPKWCYSAETLHWSDSGDNLSRRTLWNRCGSPYSASSSPLSSPSHQDSSRSSTSSGSPIHGSPGQQNVLASTCSFSDLMRGLAAKYNGDTAASFMPVPNKPLRGMSGQLKDRRTSPKTCSLAVVDSDNHGFALPPPLKTLPGLNMLDMLSWYRQNNTGISTSPVPQFQSKTIKSETTPINESNKRKRSSISEFSDVPSPLDLSHIGRSKIPKNEIDSESEDSLIGPDRKHYAASIVNNENCSTSRSGNVEDWNVEQVCAFVSSIEQCEEYVQLFEEHRINGRALAMMKAEYLTNILGMKLGPALQFCAELGKKLGDSVVCSHCSHCRSGENGGTLRKISRSPANFPPSAAHCLPTTPFPATSRCLSH